MPEPLPGAQVLSVASGWLSQVSWRVLCWPQGEREWLMEPLWGGRALSVPSGWLNLGPQWVLCWSQGAQKDLPERLRLLA